MHQLNNFSVIVGAINRPTVILTVLQTYIAFGKKYLL